MRKKIAKFYHNMTLASKIRYCYLILLIPLIGLLCVCIYYMWNGNRQYENMLNSAITASDFSMDFKKDFDYHTYLLIVGNTTLDESGLDELLNEATRVVRDLETVTDSKEIVNAKKYLENLSVYKKRIEQNLIEGNKYEKNIEIWENDIQIVTSLIRENILQYIYYEIKDIQQARAEYQDFYMMIIRISIISFIGIAVLIVLFSYYVPQSITKPIREISGVTDQVAKGDLTVRSTVQSGSDVGVLSTSLNSMIDEINRLLEQVTKEQVRLRKAELELLQSQINPHFLYNTLDTIIWLAEAGSQKQVVSMVKSLSEFFRTSLSQGKDIVTIGEELLHVRSYLEIQQVRYRDILDYEIGIPEELMQYTIPKMTIQPLVENALYHGIKNKRGLGKIVITGKKREDYFILNIIDNGIGMTEEGLQEITERIGNKPQEDGGSYGLYNVNERIKLKFGDSYGIMIKSVYQIGTNISIRLPYERIENQTEIIKKSTVIERSVK